VIAVAAIVIVALVVSPAIAVSAPAAFIYYAIREVKEHE
jgi:hypothetical protein